MLLCVQEEVVFDGSDLFAPLPVGLKLWCQHYTTLKYHPCKILDRKTRTSGSSSSAAASSSSSSSSSSSAVRSLSDIGGIAQLPEALASLAAQLRDHPHLYYIHYIDWDRRMDEWTTRDRMLLPSQIELISQQQRPHQPHPSAAPQPQGMQQTQPGKGGGDTVDSAAAAGGAGATSSQSADAVEMEERFDAALTLQPSASSSSLKELAALPSSSPSPPPLPLLPGVVGGESLLVAADAHGGSMVGGHGQFSEDDLKAHEEATKVKNVDAISFGPYRMNTWYYSPFPPEYARHAVLHFCEYCLSFFGLESELQRHARRCILRHPPGYEIYRSEESGVTVSMFEVDGQRETVYCQNLCYLAKLFLDHKTLEFDATPFLFYVLTERDPQHERGYHIVGYFSKEKISATGYNLAWSHTPHSAHTPHTAHATHATAAVSHTAAFKPSNSACCARVCVCVVGAVS